MKIIVIGAGHAGIEAAYAAAKMGAQVILVTIQLESIAQMSCNPSIGGIAKGHLVKEIDALGGIMPQAADRSGIHFKILNQSKGPAVRATRTQNDKTVYRCFLKEFLESIPDIQIYQAIATHLIVQKGKIQGVRLLSGELLPADALIITAGTFLDGKIYVGDTTYPAGRANEMSAVELALSIRESGFQTIRLKTGTPMRLHADTIDWNRVIPQPGDEPPTPFSFYTRHRVRNRILCHIGRTTPEVKKIIQDHIHLSPLYSGKISGIGPRYCPSIEDKIMKFPDRETHHFFLEPEGLKTREIYVNGLSSSLPVAVQEKILQAVPGLEKARMTRHAYAVEYDAIVPTQLHPSLESRSIGRLFFAGQVNGTSGYEEAAAQGLMAGINAVLCVREEPPFIVDRSKAYIGVLIDDLVGRGVDEPYRLFTSRAEYRLQLREDNAFERLGEHALKLKLIGRKEYNQQMRILETRQSFAKSLSRCKVRWEEETINAYQLLKRPGQSLVALRPLHPDLPWPQLNQADIGYIEANIKYSGYIEIQQREIEKNRKMEETKIPAEIDYFQIPGLSTEVRQKLQSVRPATFREARRISGVTPSALNALHIYLTLCSRKNRSFP